MTPVGSDSINKVSPKISTKLSIRSGQGSTLQKPTQHQLFKQPSSRISSISEQEQMMMTQGSGHAGTNADLMYVEDYNAEIDDKFVKHELKPYLSGVFADYALRSSPPSSTS
jgi:hypothetical protein